MNVKQLNYSLYKAAEHLAEAGKYIMILDKNRGMQMLAEADVILSIIKPEEEKMSTERLNDVLSEIFDFNLESK
jgi:hypothetical protein